MLTPVWCEFESNQRSAAGAKLGNEEVRIEECDGQWRQALKQTRDLYPSHTALRERRDASLTETGRLLRDFYNTCVAVTRHDFCVTPSRLTKGPLNDRRTTHPTNCMTDPWLEHDRHEIIILIHDRRTTPSRRFQSNPTCWMTIIIYGETRWNNLRCALQVRWSFETWSLRVTAHYLYQSHKSRSLPAVVMGNSRIPHIRFTCATPPRPMLEYNNGGRPHEFGDCCTTSVTAVRRVQVGPTTGPRLNSHRAVVEKNWT